MSFDRLIKKIIEMKNPSVAGLDPRLEYVPEYITKASFEKYGVTLKAAAEAILTFNKALIDELYDVVPAIKPQAAYYEMYGWEGVRVLTETISYAKSKGMYVMTDGKRNDIGATMEAYAAAHLGTVAVGDQTFEPFGADALTVNGYLGTDGIAPLLKICTERDKGIFVFAAMGDMCEKWGENTIGEYSYSAVGAVVGATYPEQLSELRKRLPHTMFLVPGYGAQGGGAEGLRGAFDENGLGAIVNSSRAIMCAYKKEGCNGTDFAKAARREAVRMREDIVKVTGLSK